MSGEGAGPIPGPYAFRRDNEATGESEDMLLLVEIDGNLRLVGRVYHRAVGPMADHVYATARLMANSWNLLQALLRAREGLIRGGMVPFVEEVDRALTNADRAPPDVGLFPAVSPVAVAGLEREILNMLEERFEVFMARESKNPARVVDGDVLDALCRLARCRATMKDPVRLQRDLAPAAAEVPPVRAVAVPCPVQPRGCICPVGAEATCRSMNCGRGLGAAGHSWAGQHVSWITDPGAGGGNGR
ncbi:MAG TPA: hypothetical protein VMV33_17350 [Rhodocyclaceae bacterium]|nr:hypothetical protein [Rhodocyclaceae bacterium]